MYKTLKERGYHMSEQDVEQVKDKALGKAIRSKEEAAVAWKRLEDFAKELESVSKLILTNPRNLLAVSIDWFKPERFKSLLEDHELAQLRAIEATSEANKLGISI